MGLFGRRRDKGVPALREMPTAPGVGKVHAHAAAGKAAIRFDTVKGPTAESVFTPMFGFAPAQAAALGDRAWAEGVKFREFTVKGAEGAERQTRAVKRLDLGSRVSVLAIESEAGGGLGRAVPLFWSDLTHTCEPTWAKRFGDHLGAWIEANVDAPNGSVPLGFAAADFAWYGDTYLRGAAMPLEVAAVAEDWRGVPPPKEEAVRAVVYPGGKASDPDEFDLIGTVLTTTEANYEGGQAFIVRLQIAPLESIDLWLHASKMARVPRPGEGVEARARLFALWAGQRSEDLEVG